MIVPRRRLVVMTSAMASPTRAWLLLSLVSSVALLGACGGNVLVDPGGAGAGGGSAGSCDARLVTLAQKIAAAETCNPLINAVQCSGTASVTDGCGCQVIANETNPSAVAAAQAAYEAASAASCIAPCAAPCPYFGPGFCDPATGKCVAGLLD